MTAKDTDALYELVLALKLHRKSGQQVSRRLKASAPAIRAALLTFDASAGWLPIPENMPVEWEPVLGLRDGDRAVAYWFTHSSGDVFWSFRGTSGHPILVRPPTHYTALPPLPAAPEAT